MPADDDPRSRDASPESNHTAAAPDQPATDPPDRGPAVGEVNRGTTVDDLLAAVDLPLGLVAGAAAYVFGYVCTYALVAVDAGADVAAVTSQFGTSATTAVGWLFYGANYVPMELSAGVQTRTVNMLSGSTLAIPRPVYLAVPLLTLFLAGFAITRIRREPTDSTIESAVRGGSVVAGYLPLMIVGSFVFVTVDEQQSVQVVYGIATGTAAFAGLLLPLLAGGLGGYLAR